MLVLAHESALDRLRAQVSGLTLRLYANGITPSPGDTLADYEEVQGGGYRPVALDDSQWVESPDGSGFVYPVQRFLFSAPIGSVFGFYLARDGKLFAAERFEEPWPIEVAGSYGDVTLEFSE